MAAIAIAPWCAQAAPDESDNIVFRYDPLNNDDAVLVIQRWPHWYYHISVNYGDQSPNSNAAPVFSLRLRLRSDETYGDMQIEIVNNAGLFSSDAMGHLYDLRITQTSWHNGTTSSPAFSLGDVKDEGVVQADVDTVRGLTVEQIANVVPLAIAETFGNDGRTPRQCATLLLHDDSTDLRVSCVEVCDKEQISDARGSKRPGTSLVCDQ